MPQPAVAIPTARPSRLRSTTELLTPNLNDSKEEKSVSAQEIKPALVQGKVVELNFENLQSAWTEFAENRRIQKNSTTEEIALRRSFSLVDHSIEIALDNDHQLEAIQGMRYDLLSFLKARFNTTKLDINPRVAPQEVQRLPYTPVEKFNFLAEKNPQLIELKQVLGLDVDF